MRGARSSDDLQHCLGLLEQLAIAEPDHTYPVARQVGGPACVAFLSVVAEVLAAIELDREMVLSAVEVEDEGPERMLPSELQAAEPSSAQ